MPKIRTGFLCRKWGKKITKRVQRYVKENLKEIHFTESHRFKFHRFLGPSKHPVMYGYSSVSNEFKMSTEGPECGESRSQEGFFYRILSKVQYLEK